MKHRKKWCLTPLLCILTAVTLIIAPVFTARALLNEEQAVHINPQEIEAGTLIIGTHLIHISALSDSVYTAAQESASRSGQSGSYYKSELAGGAWLDITDATNLKDITAGGDVVKDAVIAELFLTHHTKSDQITYDLLTGQAVNPLDITDPYDISGLPEFEELSLQYEQLEQQEELSERDEEAVEIARKFLEMEISNEETEKWDSRLANLHQIKLNMAAENNTGLLGTLDAVMESADASRRALVYEKLSGESANLMLSELQQNGKDSLSDSLSSGIIAAADAMLKNEAKIKGNDAGTAGAEERRLLEELYDSAGEAASGKCAELLGNLKSLANAGNRIVEGEQDLTYIRTTLVPAAENSFFERVTQGVSEEYQELAGDEAVTQNSLQTLLKEQKSRMTAARLELQALVQLMSDALDESERIVLPEQLLTKAAESEIPADDFSIYAQAELEAYTDCISNLQNAVSGGSEIERERASLEQEKENYLMQKAEALDRNELAKAKEIDFTIAEIDKKLEPLGGSSQPAIGDAKRNALAAIENGEIDEAGKELESLTALAGDNAPEALAAMKEIYDKLNTQKYLEEQDASECEELLEAIEQAVAENADLLKDSLSPETLDSLLAEYLGSSLAEADSKSQAAALVAVHLYGEHTGALEIRELTAEIAEQLKNTNPYLYLQYPGAVEYLPTNTIGQCMQYRYVFHRSQLRATLSKRGTYYEFYANNNSVQTGSGKPEQMSYEAKHQKVIYIDEDYAYQTFGCQAVYLSLSNQGILVTDEMMEAAEEIFDYLLQQGGE